MSARRGHLFKNLSSRHVECFDAETRYRLWKAPYTGGQLFLTNVAAPVKKVARVEFCNTTDFQLANPASPTPPPVDLKEPSDLFVLDPNCTAVFHDVLAMAKENSDLTVHLFVDLDVAGCLSQQPELYDNLPNIVILSPTLAQSQQPGPRAVDDPVETYVIESIFDVHTADLGKAFVPEELTPLARATGDEEEEEEEDMKVE